MRTYTSIIVIFSVIVVVRSMPGGSLQEQARSGRKTCEKNLITECNKIFKGKTPKLEFCEECDQCDKCGAGLDILKLFAGNSDLVKDIEKKCEFCIDGKDEKGKNKYSVAKCKSDCETNYKKCEGCVKL